MPITSQIVLLTSTNNTVREFFFPQKWHALVPNRPCVRFAHSTGSVVGRCEHECPITIDLLNLEVESFANETTRIDKRRSVVTLFIFSRSMKYVLLKSFFFFVIFCSLYLSVLYSVLKRNFKKIVWMIQKNNVRFQKTKQRSSMLDFLELHHFYRYS